MQKVFVLIIFVLALSYLLKKFIWTPIFETRKRSMGTLDGGKTKCGNKDCGCH